MWQLFMQTLAALLSTFGLTKTEEQKIQEAIAEQLKDPTQEPPGIPTPAPPPRKSRVEELAHAMEMVETSNQNPKTLGVRLNNPDCLKFVKGKLNTGTSKHQRVRQVPNLQLRQASTTPLTPIRDDRENGCLQCERHNQAIHLHICEFITREQEGELRTQSVRGPEDSGDNSF